MSSELIFYTNPLSRGRIVRWMLEELQVPYSVEVLEYDTSIKSPQYLAINPLGKVPAIMHNGRVVTETAAICAYLAEAYPNAGLAPTPDERADYYRWLFFTAGPVEAAITNRSIYGADPAPDKQRMAGYGNLSAALDGLSHAVTANPYIAGARFTAADVYVGAQIGWGLQFGTMEKRPEFIEYFSRLSSRDAFVRANQMDDELAAVQSTN
ncbi:glutathione S-transferase family protein [Microbulbifer sp. SA54]|uniref:glutathione S-transferase family protein n=1 Tax=Microbulbifer sp. SA54 TaxID=3401577 RepID=UPI003AABCC34